MYIQRGNNEGSFPIAYIRCKIDSKGIVEHVVSANKEASKLLNFNLDEHLNEPMLPLYPKFSKYLPWHSIFLIPSIHQLPYTKKYFAPLSEEYYSVTALSCSFEDEVVFLLKDISLEHYLNTVQDEITKTQFDLLVFLDDSLNMQDIITSNDKEYLTRSREELIGFSMREVFGNDFAIPMENLALSSKKLGKKTSMIFHSPETYDTRRFKIIAQSITTPKGSSYILSIKNITSNIDISGSLTDSIQHGIIVHDQRGIICTVNNRIFEMTGFKSDEVIGNPLSTLLCDTTSIGEHETMLFNKKQELHRVRVASTSISCNPIEQKIVTVVTNITEVQATERLLERKIAFENILFDLTSRLFITNDLTFDPMVDHALKVLGEFTGADRAYIFFFREGETMENTHEWCGPNITPEKDNLKQLPNEVFPHWVATLLAGKEIYFKKVDELNEDWAAEREILLAQSVKSVLVHPIIGEGFNFGYIGFDAVTSYMSWNKEERQLLRFFANNLGEVLSRNKNTKEMNEMREKAERLAKEREVMNQELNSFFAKMSHEIRNSINSIIGVNTMLLDTDLTPYQQRLANIINSSGDFLTNLVRDVLDYSRLDQSNVELHTIPFSITLTIEQVAESLNQSAAEKGISITYHHDNNIPSLILGDQIKLSQIVTNLVSNAIKYSNQGKIIITTELEEIGEKEITISISVADSGVGIKSENLSKIFEPYYQVDSSSSLQHESTGLGLSIVKWLTEAMGGTISVNSIYNRGSTFTVAIPFQVEIKPRKANSLDDSWRHTRALIINEDTHRAKEIATTLTKFEIDVDTIHTMEEFSSKVSIIEAEDHPYSICFIDESMMKDAIYKKLISCKKEGIHDNHLIFLTSKSPIDLSVYEIDDKEIVDGTFVYPVDPNQLIDEIYSKMRVVESKKEDIYNNYRVLSALKALVVEDIEINQEILLYQLGKVGIQCEAVSNGHAAIERIKQSKFDVILLDIRMPGIDGYETTRLIRALPKEEHSGVVIIAMTANININEKEKCLIAGMDDYLPKPIKPEDLYGMLLQYLPDEILFPEPHNRYKVEHNNQNLPPIEGVDIQKALSFLNHDMELFTHLINQFYISYKDVIHLYNETADDDKERIRFVHSVKSVSANLGATKLSYIAAKLEDMITEEEYEEYAPTQHEFMNEFSLLLNAIKHSPYFDRSIKKETIQSDSYPEQEVIALLNILKDGLESGKNRVVNDSLKKVITISFDGLVKEKITTLQNFIRLYNYTEAIQQVDEIMHLLTQQGK